MRKMYLDIELYNYYEGRKIIIDNGNIDRYKLIYSAMQAPQMKMENSNYIVSCFVISSCNTKVDQYEFIIMRDGQISFNKTVKYDSHTKY
jgi:regulator of RNase E activity RraB